MIYAQESTDVKELTGKQAKEQLKKILDKLNELDPEDFFGTEGWEVFIGFRE